MGIKRKLFVTVLLAIAALPLSAQSTVAHEIVKGNTIYSLAKEYGSTVEAINEANPNIGVRSLVIGETLIIPISKDTLEDFIHWNAPLVIGKHQYHMPMFHFLLHARKCEWNILLLAPPES